MVGFLARTAIERVTWFALRTRIFAKIRPRVCHLSSFTFQGKTKTSHDSLRSSFFGGKEIAHYFLQLSYDQESKIEFDGRTTYNEILSVAQEKKADIVFVDADRIFSRFLFSKGFLLLPYVNFVLDVSGTLDTTIAGMNRNKKRIFRKIDELGYSYETTRDLEKCRLFYRDMYLPHVRERYAESARPLSWVDFEKHLRKGGLMLVKLEGEYVSGILYSPNGEEVRSLVLGVSNVQEHMSDGAASAPLRFLISWAKENGFKRIDYGSTYPFFKDGVFLYKKTWGMRIRPIEGKDAKIIAVKFDNFRNAREFLLANPSIVYDSGRLVGIVFSDSDIERIREEYYVPGLSGLVVYTSRVDSANKSPEDKYKFSQSLHRLTRMASEEGFVPHYINFSDNTR